VSKKIKELELTALRATLKGVRDCVMVEPIKVDAATDFTFRKTLRGKAIRTAMVKNTLAKKVLAENGVTVADGVWEGTTLLCWGADSVKALATTLGGAIKDAKKDPKQPDKYKVKSAVADGQQVTFDVAKTIPTRLEAIGDVLAAILGPGSALAGCLAGPGGQVAGLVQAVSEKKDETPAAPPAA
jgi:large subunit ribosomal protein L10